MEVKLFDNKLELGQAAADDAAGIIQQAIADREAAYVIAATGASQFDVLDGLLKKNIDWGKVVFFHLDEYVDLPEAHPASFRRYLKERIIYQVQARLFHLINAHADKVQEECR